jgi:hypothetical protein
MRLSLGVLPQPDESLAGILVRLAERVCIRGADRLAAMAVLRQPGSAVTPHDLSTLAAIGSFDPSDLDRAAYRPSERFGHNRFLAGDVHRELLDLSRRRLCPICLSNSPHHRMPWDLGLLTACPDHAVRLLVRCPRCRRSLDWRYPSVTRCRCGAALDEAETDPVPASERRTAERLLELLGPDRAVTVPTALAELGGSDLIRMAMALGMLMTGWRRDRRVESLVAAGPDRTAEVMGAGLAAIDDWPVTLHAFLRRLADDAASRSGRYGARKTLGVFYDWLTIMEEGGAKRILLKATADFVGTDRLLERRAHRSRLLATGSPNTRNGMALTEVKAALGARAPKVAKLVELRILPAGDGDGRGIPMVFDRQAVSAYAEVANRSVTLAEAARLLGVSKDRFRRLANAGVLGHVHRASERGLGTWAIDRAEIAGFVRKLEADGAPVTGEDIVGFEFAVEALRLRGRRFVEVVEMIGYGVLPVAGIDARAIGLKRLRFRRSDVRLVGREADERPRITIAEAAARLGMKWEMVAHLVRRGLIGSDGNDLDAAEVERFALDHVTGAELARRRGTSPRALATRLASDGILPVVGPNVDGGRQNVYRRDQLKSPASGEP